MQKGVRTNIVNTYNDVPILSVFSLNSEPVMIRMLELLLQAGNDINAVFNSSTNNYGLYVQFSIFRKLLINIDIIAPSLRHLGKNLPY